MTTVISTYSLGQVSLTWAAVSVSDLGFSNYNSFCQFLDYLLLSLFSSVSWHFLWVFSLFTHCVIFIWSCIILWSIVGLRSLGSLFFFWYERHKRKFFIPSWSPVNFRDSERKSASIGVTTREIWRFKFCNTFPMEKPFNHVPLKLSLWSKPDNHMCTFHNYSLS